MVKRRLIDGIRETWQEVRALEIEAVAVAEELECEDALMPDLRAFLQSARARLEQLANKRLLTEEIGDLPEPDEEYFARVTRVFRPDAR